MSQSEIQRIICEPDFTSSFSVTQGACALLYYGRELVLNPNWAGEENEDLNKHVSFLLETAIISLLHIWFYWNLKKGLLQLYFGKYGWSKFLIHFYNIISFFLLLESPLLLHFELQKQLFYCICIFKKHIILYTCWWSIIVCFRIWRKRHTLLHFTSFISKL